MFLKIGSMQGKQPAMFAMVAVGAIAMVFELRMPNCFTCSRTGVQSKVLVRDTSIRTPRSCSSKSMVSSGKIPRSHLEPLYDWYVPRYFAN